VTTSSSRVLVTGQTDTTENGIYKSDTGDWTREPDWDGANDAIPGTMVRVVNGTSNYGYWAVTTPSTGAITVGTTAVSLSRVDADGVLREDLANTTDTTKGDALIGVKRTDTGAVATTKHALDEVRVLDVALDFGADNTGATGIITELTAALAASTTVKFSAGTYLFDADSTGLLGPEHLLILENGAILKAATGVQVHGNTCQVRADLTQHFSHDAYDTQWATSTAYVAGDIVQYGYGRYYKCTSNHTSGTWTTDKATKWTSFAPFSFFQREEGDMFVYPEWFGAIADNGTTPCSRPFAKALSCNSVMCSLKLIDVSGTITNGYYDLEHPLVVLNGRTLAGGFSDRSFPLLRLNGTTWEGGNLGVSTEEVANTPTFIGGYTSFKNLRFQLENFSNASFVWFNAYFLETSSVEQITWEFISTNSISQVAQFQGGPVNIQNLNIVYGDSGTVAEYPLYINCYNGCTVRNINYKNQLGAKGLRIRPGRFTDISGIFIETPPTTVTEAYLYVEEVGNSNGRIGEVYITNNKSADSTGLAVEVYSNTGVNSYLSNVVLENIYILPHDGTGSTIDNIIKINGTTWTKTQLQDATGSNYITLKRVSQDEFLLAGTRNQYSDGPVKSSWHVDSIASAGTYSINFAPILRQGTNSDVYAAWCGLIMISARGGAVDHGYLAFVSLTQDAAAAYVSAVTELAGAANWTVAWNSTNFQWDITNDNANAATQAIITFLHQGPNIFTK